MRMQPRAQDAYGEFERIPPDLGLNQNISGLPYYCTNRARGIRNFRNGATPGTRALSGPQRMSSATIWLRRSIKPEITASREEGKAKHRGQFWRWYLGGSREHHKSQEDYDHDKSEEETLPECQSKSAHHYYHSLPSHLIFREPLFTSHKRCCPKRCHPPRRRSGLSTGGSSDGDADDRRIFPC
jgi:hypothetical protein